MRLPPKDRLLLPVIWFLTITWLSTKGGISLPGFKIISADKLGHIAAYALLGWLILLAYGKKDNALLGNVWLFCFVYGAIMEWIQYTFFPNRFFELDDMVANGIGAAVGVLAFRFLYKR